MSSLELILSLRVQGGAGFFLGSPLPQLSASLLLQGQKKQNDSRLLTPQASFISWFCSEDAAAGTQNPAGAVGGIRGALHAKAPPSAPTLSAASAAAGNTSRTSARKHTQCQMFITLVLSQSFSSLWNTFIYSTMACCYWLPPSCV